MVFNHLHNKLKERTNRDTCFHQIRLGKPKHGRTSSWILADALSPLTDQTELLDIVASYFNQEFISESRVHYIKELVHTGCRASLPLVISLAKELHTSDYCFYDGGVVVRRDDGFYEVGIFWSSLIIKQILENDSEDKVNNIFASLHQISHLEPIRFHAGADKEPDQFTKELFLRSISLYKDIGSDGLDHILSTIAAIGQNADPSYRDGAMHLVAKQAKRIVAGGLTDIETLVTVPTGGVYRMPLADDFVENDYLSAVLTLVHPEQRYGTDNAEFYKLRNKLRTVIKEDRAIGSYLLENHVNIVENIGVETFFEMIDIFMPINKKYVQIQGHHYMFSRVDHCKFVFEEISFMHEALGKDLFARVVDLGADNYRDSSKAGFDHSLKHFWELFGDPAWVDVYCRVLEKTNSSAISIPDEPNHHAFRWGLVNAVDKLDQFETTHGTGSSKYNLFACVTRNWLSGISQRSQDYHHRYKRIYKQLENLCAKESASGVIFLSRYAATILEEMDLEGFSLFQDRIEELNSYYLSTDNDSWPNKSRHLAYLFTLDNTRKLEQPIEQILIELGKECREKRLDPAQIRTS